MTPAEWLAALFLFSLTLSTLWELVDPESLVLTFNSKMRLLLALATQIAVIVLSLIVLAAGPALTVAVVSFLVMAVILTIAKAI